MSIFRRPDYQSDTTQFIDRLKAEKPELEAEQRKGRELLWDKHPDRSAWKSFRQAEVRQKPYVYQTDPSA
ncbi:MAG: DUF3460 family protein [Burkholderiaceae bacterium]|nr:DUF3460 family protein [Rhodoferax sp.]MCB2005902.1 DUF3460 family protein [Rhodoferax sp.]MCB2028804.1 DUF3460 family protein [Rhodoferax sp.]MCB2041379.1 DUF3460 family protein [Rhodoferax sp.]MCP5261281.1 DUF3460 family protein [Rhodoferax sp.]